ncbi:MAG: 30S ribosomal protein S17 [Candidatus Berkelbacteria bacterium Licking1014_7]|uniref:30S ribosomal protein S17 n=1 Tax=Candidatus Berkelbacteria bacterium Licking1014_7 TaxID=2017147 RepID=A0A554LKK0_9BACT|nr:MAG: 30S ribosomal protein S17 [Candidatus Berkelbacteria bacterium Licking1014_7]
MKQKLIGEITTIIDVQTVKVKVETIKIHPLYKKRYKSHKNYLVDTNGKNVEKHAMVEIESTRPISKNKKWKIISKNKSISNPNLKIQISK